MNRINGQNPVCGESAMRRRLGVSDDADLQEIKAAFRHKIKKLHPDKTRSNGQHWAINQLIEAYAGLSALYKTGKPSRTSGIMNPDMETAISDIFAIGELSQASTDPEVRIAAIQALGRSRKRTAFMFIRKALFDSEPDIVRAAVSAVGALRMKQAIGDLAVVFSKGDQHTRLLVLNVLSSMDFAEGSQAVLDLALEDPDRMIRQEAARMLKSDETLHLRRRA
ncbi:HEAT repeat domain-containing protein [Spirochaeta dissipatitropha]